MKKTYLFFITFLLVAQAFGQNSGVERAKLEAIVVQPKGLKIEPFDMQKFLVAHPLKVEPINLTPIDVSCPVLNILGNDNLTKMSEELDFNKCYAKRQKREKYKTVKMPDSRQNKTELQDEVEACECFRDIAKKFPEMDKAFEKANELSNRTVTTEEESIENYKKNAQKIISRVEKNAQSLALQASLLFDSVRNEATMRYMNAIESTDLAPYAQKMTYASEDLRNKAGEVLKGMKISPAINKDLFITPENAAPGICVTPREYLAYKQFPSDNTVYDELKKPFSRENWDYDLLIKKMRALSAEGKYKDAQVYLEKIKFLNSNPLIKTFMQLHEGMELPEGFNIPQGKISELQGKLFENLKSIIPSSSCRRKECLAVAASEGKIELYKKGLQDFFSLAPAPELAKLQATINIANDLDSLAESSNFRDPGIAMSREARIDSFLKSQSMSPGKGQGEIISTSKDPIQGALNPDNCFLENIDESKKAKFSCEEIFTRYCPYIDSVNQRAKYIETTNQHDADYFIEKAEGFNQQEYERFNKDMCDKPRDSSTGSKISFNTFKDQYCKENPKNASCLQIQKFSSVVALRKIYDESFASGAAAGAVTVLNKSEVKDVDNNTVKSIAQHQNTKDKQQGQNSDFSSLREKLGLARTSSYNSDKKNTPVTSTEVKPGFSAGLANALDAVASQMGGKEGNPNQGPMIPMKYSNVQGPNSVTAVPEKVEQMDEVQKQKLLSDWKKDYEDWKKKYADEVKSNPAIAAEDAANKARIAALEQSLADQKKFTDEQRDLLNKAIAAQNLRQQQEQLQQNAEPQKMGSQRKGNSGFSSFDDGSDEVSRSPASVSKSVNTNSGSSGASFGGSNNRSSGGSSRGASSSDSGDLQREEAKLINMRSGSNGGITVETVSANNQSKANAIMVPLSDEQYKVLQTNPESINLSQLEQKIPKEQIAKLEANGEIILLLKNGTNPPFEVKVEKKNNKLVLSRVDKNGNPQEPVRRVYTLRALGDQINSVKK